MIMIFGIPAPLLFGQLLLGLINGAFYAMLSLGLAIIFGMLNIINFAHGALFMMGAFAAWMLLEYTGIGYFPALILAPLIIGVFGIVLEKTVISRLYNWTARKMVSALSSSCSDLAATVGQPAVPTPRAGDPQIGAALNAFHDSVGAPWTVESLSEAAGMSRSAFAVRFKDLLGQTPLKYVTEWRMQKAMHLLEQRDKKLIDVARSVGYESNAAFSKTFKRVVGANPGEYLKRGAVSTGRRNTGMEFTSRGIKVQSFSRALVELASHLVEVGLGVAGQVGFLREVLAQQTVGVLVGAALPGALRIAEVDVDLGGDGEVFVTGQL